ncbi:hypothetical protein [Amycolatopsis sp. RTGN1]|uniref:hypothetical protein n=1 Tax=Amycolatopsis ponsaeliensis TaxID=2992142 RepID=UPI0025502F20|nr:hypothetical protein [Amycolatopsis sp. RTGN1]
MGEAAALVIEPTRRMERWTARVGGAEAIFSCAPLVEDHTAARALPRVWAGRGLGVPAQDLPGLVAALGEVMKTPLYWRSRQPVADAPVWSAPRPDPDDGFVYVAGPCGRLDDTVGYRPVYTFTIALTDMRDLRIRLTAHLGK